MENRINRMYRVKAVAELLDVSVATIYRAIESGALRALKVGTGKGALRIPADAIEDYVKVCQQAALAAAPTLPVVA
jgi:excisionase family DNA binding protein